PLLLLCSAMAPPELHTLSLHDALPIYPAREIGLIEIVVTVAGRHRRPGYLKHCRSELGNARSMPRRRHKRSRPGSSELAAKTTYSCRARQSFVARASCRAPM